MKILPEPDVCVTTGKNSSLSSGSLKLRFFFAVQQNLPRHSQEKHHKVYTFVLNPATGTLTPLTTWEIKRLGASAGKGLS